MDSPRNFWYKGGISEGARLFPLEIFDTNISFNSNPGECISY